MQDLKPRAEAAGDAPGSAGRVIEEPGASPTASALGLSVGLVPVPASPMDLDLGEEEDSGDALPSVGKVWEEGPTRSLAAIMAESKKNAAVSHQKPPVRVEGTDLRGTYQMILGVIEKHGPSLQGLLSHGEFAGVEDGRAVIRFGNGQEQTVKMLEKHAKKDLIVEALCEVLKEKVGVRFEMENAEERVVVKSPAVAGGRQAMVKPVVEIAAVPVVPTVRLTAELRAELELDPLIRSVMEMGGSIVKVE